MYKNQLKFQPGNKKSKTNNINVGFFESMRWTLLVCRLLGLLPISGLAQNDGQKSRFTWKTFYTPIFLFVVMAQLFKLATVGVGLRREEKSVTKISSFLLACTIFCLLVALTSFCANWNKMLNEISIIEESLPPIPRKCIRVMNIIMSLMIVAAVYEHFIYQAHKYQVIQCSPLKGDSGLLLKSYALSSLKSIYKLIPFSFYTTVLFQISIFQSSYLWTFCDILIINVSIYLIARFENFNTVLTQKVKELLNSKGVDTQLPWPELQQYYTQLAKLVNILDKNINPLLFFSFTNLIFIGKQIYVILNSHFAEQFVTVCSNKKLDVIKSLYYGFSALFLLSRVAFVCCLASRVHTLSRRPLDLLYTIPASAYDDNCQRLMDQIFHSTVGLSGYHFFYVTRRMILTMLASLFTYEVMLLQNVH